MIGAQSMADNCLGRELLCFHAGHIHEYDELACGSCVSQLSKNVSNVSETIVMRNHAICVLRKVRCHFNFSNELLKLSTSLEFRCHEKLFYRLVYQLVGSLV